jgi:hypothetical protein
VWDETSVSTRHSAVDSLNYFPYAELGGKTFA